MKKWLKQMGFALVLVLLLALAACGNQAPTADGSAEADSAVETGEQGKNDSNVESINLECADGILKFVRLEKANAMLTSADNAYVFVFEFTNLRSEPAQAQNIFQIQFFQNSVEIRDSGSWSSNGGDQYELVSAYFNEALQGGTITFGRIFVPADDSPVTIMVKRNGGDADAPYQMMTVALSDVSDGGGADEALSAEEVEALLQGTWVLQNVNYFTFDNGTISVVSNGSTLNGTYTVNVQDATVDATIAGTDGNVKIHLPYTVTDDALGLFNNSGEALVKQA